MARGIPMAGKSIVILNNTAILSSNLPFKNHGHIISSFVQEIGIAEIRSAEDEALGISKKRVATSGERRYVLVIIHRAEARNEGLESFRDVALGAPDAAALAFDHVFLVRALG